MDESLERYNLLRVLQCDSKENIKACYHKLALKEHPDKPTGDSKRFSEIQDAYEILMDDEKFKLYLSKKLESLEEKEKTMKKIYQVLEHFEIHWNNDEDATEKIDNIVVSIVKLFRDQEIAIDEEQLMYLYQFNNFKRLEQLITDVLRSLDYNYVSKNYMPYNRVIWIYDVIMLINSIKETLSQTTSISEAKLKTLFNSLVNVFYNIL